MERGILMWIVVGLVAGFLAKAIMPGDDPGGLIVTILLGIGGSILGGWLATAILGAASGPAGIIGSIVGALILLAVYRMVKKKKA
jgi:uncharacterized membrane protein YeaQ/YmgE (transglycosylase-associated protein family)